MNDKMSSARILDHAAELIDRYGWEQGKSGNYLTGFCTVGAIGTVCVGMDYSEFFKSIEALEKFIGTDVVVWNDGYGRSEAEILDALHICAEKLRIQAEESITE